jgi:uncharacterized protein (TIGR00156 family)
MKGVIMQIEGDKAVVLFNNGTFGVIRAPAGCETGMGISVTSNKKIIVLLALSLCAICALLFLLARFFYVTPVGYIQITTANATLELSYNRMERIHALRPLNTQSVPIATDLAIVHKPIPQAWGDIIATFDTAGYLSGNLEVFIVQDALANAKDIQSDLVSLAESMKKTLYPALSAEFSLYTIELYQKAMTGRVQAEETPGTPDMGETHHGNGGSQTMTQRTPRVTQVRDAKNFSDDTPVTLQGTIIRFLGDEKYRFQDSSGEITIEIDSDLLKGLLIGINDRLEIQGEVDQKQMSVEIEVKSIQKIENQSPELGNSETSWHGRQGGMMGRWQGGGWCW